MCTISAWCDEWEVPLNVNKCHIPQGVSKTMKFAHENCNTKLKELCAKDHDDTVSPLHNTVNKENNDGLH